MGEKDELEKIKSSLNTIQTVIASAEERLLKDEALADWLERLKDAAYDAEDVLDEYATEDLRRKVEAQNSNSVRDPVTNKVRKMASSLLNYPVVDRAKMTIKLKKIRKRLESIEEERHKFQLSEKVQQWEREFKKHRQTHAIVDESLVYGRDKDREKIVNLLLHAVAGNEDENVSVIPIVGMGGLGKTTLAQLVFNDDRVRSHFHPKMWVCVSNDFDVERLVEKIIDRANHHFHPKRWVCVSNDFDVERLVEMIIDRATGSNSNVSDLENLQLGVQNALNERRFLLVLDDVWNEEPEKWNKLRVLLMCGGRGSRIVVTTRNPKVASIMSRIEPHQLEGLSDEDCWKLFSTRAFLGHREKDHLNLVEIGKDVVRKCIGVPLAVITLGGLLSFKKEESEWVFVRDSELWNLAAEDVYGILPALKLSYYHLKPHLRQCFAFCAIFSKDSQIDKESLIQLWMAHGCVPSKREIELEDVGIEILNELLMRSLFQEVKEYHGGDDDYILKIQVHDLVHDLAQSVMGNDCCIIEQGKTVDISEGVRVRHLSLYQNISQITHPYLKLEAQSLCIRTLQSFDHYSLFLADMAIFKFLRALHLKCPSCALPPLTSSLTPLGELIHLRYFRLENASIRSLPESISNLLNLQTLILRPCFRLRELPKGTRNLINLRCLDISPCHSLSHMPAKFGKLSCLRKLSLFVVGDSTSVCSGIEELQCLNLRGNLTIRNLERVAIPSYAQRANLIGKPNLDRLQLSWHVGTPCYDDIIKIEAEEEVLEVLQPHENLKELVIMGYGGIHFPSWMTGFLLPSIVKIILGNCSRCQLLPPLGELPSLKFLSIHHMNRVENIGSEFYGKDMSEVFPSLETLEIGHMSSLKVWSGLHGKWVFPSLQILKISNCTELKSLPHGKWVFPSLQILKISNCTEWKSLPEGIENLSSLQELDLRNLGLKSLPRGIGNLSSLELLKLQQLSLISLPKSMQDLSSLRELCIWSCPELQYLPRRIGNLSSLQLLDLHQLTSLTSLPKSMQELSTLTKLRISRCPQLPSLPEWVGNLVALQVLEVNDCPQMVSLPAGLQRLTGLQRLSINEYPRFQWR